MVAVLNITDLHKSFGGVMATQGISLDILEGELHAIIGPNGAGKTTLVSQLSGAIKPDRGRIRFKGHDITRMEPYTRARLGIARSYQITSLLMDMTVLDNVAVAVQAREGHSFRFLRSAQSISRINDRAMAVLDQVRLSHQAHTRAGAMSHGERRQLEIAVALATEAEFLLLDEPMAGMGTEESAKMIELLQQLKGNKTMLLIEHDMDAVFALADRVSVLVYGQIIATGKPDDIRNNEDVRHAYLGDV